jgi:hypothetical protein
MAEKEWADIDDFATAFYVACAMHGWRLTKKEIVMLAEHYEIAKEEHFVQSFWDQARIELGIGIAMTLVQLDAVGRKARELAAASRDGGV